MINDLEFRKVNNLSQEQLNSDIKQIKNNNKIFVFADLVNPSKSSIGKISKVILDKMNNIIQSKYPEINWKTNRQWFNGSSISKTREVHLSLFLTLKAFTRQSRRICLKVQSNLQKNQLISLITICYNKSSTENTII